MTDFQEKYNSHHKRLSYIKSAIRMAAYLLAIIYPMTASLLLVFGLLLFAEILGIIEEWV